MIITPVSGGNLHAVLDGSQILICENATNSIARRILISDADRVRRIIAQVFWDDTYRIILAQKNGVRLVSVRDKIQFTQIECPLPVINAQWVSFGLRDEEPALAVKMASALAFWRGGQWTALFPYPISELTPLAFSQGYAWLWRNTSGTNVLSFLRAKLGIKSFRIPRVHKISASPDDDAVAIAGVDGLLLVFYSGETQMVEGHFAQVAWMKSYVVVLTHYGTIELYSEMLEKKFILAPNSCLPASIRRVEADGYIEGPADRSKFAGDLNILASPKTDFIAVSNTEGVVWIWNVLSLKLCGVFEYSVQPSLRWQGKFLVAILKQSHTVGIWSPEDEPELLQTDLSELQGVQCDDDGIFIYGPEGRQYVHR